MLKRFLFVAGLAVHLAGPAAFADTLPLPANLIGLDSPAGQKLLFEAESRAAYFPLSLQFVTQQSQSFCGVASLVMVLNALKVPAPPILFDAKGKGFALVGTGLAKCKFSPFRGAYIFKMGKADLKTALGLPNITQNGLDSLRAYAQELIGEQAWAFWWD